MTEAALTYYDIASSIQPRSYAPNPSKSRFALSFKDVTFKTTFLELDDIPKVRKGLDCKATRAWADGSDYYTLPMLQTPDGQVLGDTFDIALYLNEMHPDSGAGRLFPNDIKGTGLDYETPCPPIAHVPVTTNEGKPHPEYARFNWHVDTTFTSHVILVAYYMPFKPETKEATQKIFLDRANMQSWEQFKVEGDAREGIKAAFKENLTSLAQLYMVNKEGPYLEGEKATYADIIVGGWLNMFHECMPKEELEDFRTWHDGVFARLYDALHEKYYVCQ